MTYSVQKLKSVAIALAALHLCLTTALGETSDSLRRQNQSTNLAPITQSISATAILDSVALD